MTIDSKEFRATLGRFLSGVTVVSTETDGVIHAMTANAFTSVSLDPPLVLVAVSKKARFYGHVSESKSYGVSILTAEQQPLSDHFAGRPGDVPVQWEHVGSGRPVLAGALAQLSCTVTQMVDAGDHVLVIGQVEQLWQGEGAPLVYFRGKYGL